MMLFEHTCIIIIVTIFLKIFLGKIVSRIAPSYQVVGSENYSALSRDPDQVNIFSSLIYY